MLTSRRNNLLFGGGLLAAILVTLVIYWPGLNGPFIFDDYANLQPLGIDGGIHDSDSLRRFVFGNTSGPTGRPVSMLSFLIDGQDWPPYVKAFKYTNLMIHVLCGLLLAWFIYLIALHRSVNKEHAAWIALAGALLWMIHPLNASTTLYVVQRMTQLMTLFALAALIAYVKGRELMDSQPRRGLLLLGLSLFPLGLLSVLSKENGALLLLLMVIAEHTVLIRRPTSSWYKLWYRVGVLAPLAVLVVFFLYTVVNSYDAYQYRSFTLIERQLTEFRILVLYLSKIVFPSALGVGLYHDDLPISRSLIDPLSTLFSALLLIALLIAAFRWRRTQPVFSFAVLWFYAMHIMESTVVPLELYFEHRNYMSMMGPVIALTWYAALGLQWLTTKAARAAASSALAFLLVIAMWLTYQIASLWGNVNELYAYWAFEKPESIRTQWVYADYLIVTGNPDGALEVLERTRQRHPRELAVLLQLWNISCEAGREPPVSLPDIARMEGLQYYINNANPLVNTLLQNYFVQTCEYPPYDDLVALFERIAALPQAQNRLSNFYFYYSDFYVFNGQLNPALIQLTKAFQLNANLEIPIRQAILAASAGSYADALVFLERAREANGNRNPLVPSIEPRIRELETDFRRLLESQSR